MVDKWIPMAECCMAGLQDNNNEMDHLELFSGIALPRLKKNQRVHNQQHAALSASNETKFHVRLLFPKPQPSRTINSSQNSLTCLNNQPQSQPISTHKKTPLPDFLLTALSLFLIVSSPKTRRHQSPPQIPCPHQLPPTPADFSKSLSCLAKTLNPKRRFATPQSLSEWFRPRLPSDSFASWGVKPGSKNVHSLWIEIADGETSLADSTPPVRTLDVVVVRIIGQDGRILIESHQELSDGIVRNRCRPLSEKMKPGESVEDAVTHAVREELGSIIGDSCDLRIVPEFVCEEGGREGFGFVYPGLPACYALHSVDAWVGGFA
ncbi:hypothetical protein Acr_18g0005480 [Actinidia rufa]|uniref:Nudix hydrolase domain-containing protein n=1 Tax=Actinidia rufa TaxID=165716 RepID=A0A7J0G6G7_9ERIC|nr:hypothetical protein Acr_18g0005480 [Actinidia rufa]